MQNGDKLSTLNNIIDEFHCYLYLNQVFILAKWQNHTVFVIFQGRSQNKIKKLSEYLYRQYYY